jgi:hypothetical protein
VGVLRLRPTCGYGDKQRHQSHDNLLNSQLMESGYPIENARTGWLKRH